MIQIRIAGKHIEIADALTQHVRAKLSAAVEKHFDRHAEARVTFMKEKTGFRADRNVHLSSASSMQAHGEAPNAHHAFDIALDRPEKQLRRYTRQLKDHHHDRPGQNPAGLA